MLVFWAKAMPIDMAQSQKIVAFFMKTFFESAFIFILNLCKVKSLKGFY
jgi:hypothetical protein